jgi:hypothetical protein
VWAEGLVEAVFEREDIASDPLDAREECIAKLTAVFSARPIEKARFKLVATL